MKSQLKYLVVASMCLGEVPQHIWALEFKMYKDKDWNYFDLILEVSYIYIYIYIYTHT